MGTPITGSVVLAAMAPARCAALPAAAMMTPKPLSRAQAAKSPRRFRCAMRGKYAHAERNFQRFERIGAGAHYAQVAVAAHYYGYLAQNDPSCQQCLRTLFWDKIMIYALSTLVNETIC